MSATCSGGCSGRASACWIGEEPYRVETVAEAVERGATGPAGLIEIVEANIQVLLRVAAACLCRNGAGGRTVAR